MFDFEILVETQPIICLWVLCDCFLIYSNVIMFNSIIDSDSPDQDLWTWKSYIGKWLKDSVNLEHVWRRQ